MTDAAAEGSSGGEFQNPIANRPAFEQEPQRPESLSGTELVADLDYTLTPDELSDLTYAFQALDINKNGTIEPVELHAMMAVLGAEVELDVARQLFQRTKAEFRDWEERHADKLLPAAMDYQRQSAKPTRPLLHIPFSHKVSGNQVASAAARATRNPIVGPVVDSIGSGADRVLNLSSTMVRGAASQIGLGSTAAERAERSRLADLQKDPDSLIFAEYTHMMESRYLLEELVPGDWHKRAAIMRDLRRAFDIADVDGSDAVEFDEFEMVITSLNPMHGLSHDDVLYLWDLMMAESPHEARTPGKELKTMNFLQFLHGMSAVAKDEKAAGWLDLEQPNKWELLSLLVDTPVSAAEERALLEKLSGMEQMGIKMLQNDQAPMDKERMRAVLKRAGNGDLRRLNPEQVARMHSLKKNGWLLCGFIGFATTIVPCAVENYLVAEIGIDGVKDRFDVCQPFSVIQWDGNSSSIDERRGTMTYPTQAIRDNWGSMMCQVRPMNSSRVLNRTASGGDEWYDSMRIQPAANFYDWAVYYDVKTVADRAICLPGSRWSGVDDKLALCESCECEVCQCFHHSDGVIGGEFEVRENSILRFWVILGIAIGINVVVEILLLMRVSVMYCTKVAWALDQRLVPLNADRAFVADSLVRAAFELGNPNTPMMGVDPQAQPKSKTKVVTMVLLYKAKVVLLGIVLKQIVALTTPAGFAAYAMPWVGTCGGTVFWDALISACVLLQAQIRGFGIYTSIEVFNDVLQELEQEAAAAAAAATSTDGETATESASGSVKATSLVSEEGKIQIARAIGVGIVQNGSMYPTMELHLRHAIAYLKLAGKECTETSGVLDNAADLIRWFSPESGLPARERRTALSIYLLNCILDGTMDRLQEELWEKMCGSASDLAVFEPARIRDLTTRFRGFEVITAEDLRDCYDPNCDTNVPSACNYQFVSFEVQRFLTC